MSTTKVKGSTLLSRRARFAERIGADAYDRFVVELAAKHATFPQPMLGAHRLFRNLDRRVRALPVSCSDGVTPRATFSVDMIS